MGATVEATERDQFWLDHEAAFAASDLTAKAYAAPLRLMTFWTSAVAVATAPNWPPGRIRRMPRLDFPSSVAASRLSGE